MLRKLTLFPMFQRFRIQNESLVHSFSAQVQTFHVHAVSVWPFEQFAVPNLHKSRKSALLFTGQVQPGAVSLKPRTHVRSELSLGLVTAVVSPGVASVQFFYCLCSICGVSLCGSCAVSVQSLSGVA